jgi:cytidylate kinase
MKKITIAIDGFSSTGKSTIAKQLAKKMSYIYIDSGAMYRAVCLYAMEQGLISENLFDKKNLIDSLNRIYLQFKFNPHLGFSEIYLNDRNVEFEIRKLEVSNLVSKIAAVPEVRRMLVKQQQEYGANKGVVMDGRDIGTVVFPNAECKLFITASAEVRAKRRFDELKKRGDQVSYDDILKNITDRDHIDSTREDSPLVQSTDAIMIDNSEMTLEEQFNKIYGIVLKQMEED